MATAAASSSAPPSSFSFRLSSGVAPSVTSPSVLRGHLALTLHSLLFGEMIPH